MKKVLTTILVSLAATISSYASSQVIKDLNNAPVAILTDTKNVFVVTPNSISILKKGILTNQLSTPSNVNGAIIKDNKIWAATLDGIVVYDISNGIKESKKLLSNTRISTLDIDKHGRIWAAAPLKGAYLQESNTDSFTLKLNAIGCYALQCTADSNVWIGSSVGLYRLNENDFSYTRYAEEGYSGYELPDNIVERLYKDDQSNIWVIMPDNISFKSSKNYNGEIPSYAYIGDKSNTIKTIIPMPQTSYLFVTEKSISFLPSSSLNEHHHGGTSEVFTEENIQAYALTPKQLQTPSALINEPIIDAEKSKSYIYFVTAKGGWRVKEKDLIKKILK